MFHYNNIFNLPGVPKMYLNLALYFEAVATIMLGILGFSASLDLYNSLDTLLVCVHDLMNKWQQDIIRSKIH